MRPDLRPIDPETPIRLTEAARLRGLSPGALRAERDRGRLLVSRVAGKDWTTLAAIDRMFELCRVAPKAPIYGSGQLADPPPASAPPPGSSSTEAAKLAQAAALATIERLSSGLRHTSPKNISRSAPNVVSIKSQLRT